MIKAVCFDLDGVLVDACDLHKEALEKAMLSTVGYKISEEDHKTKFNGLPTKQKLKALGVSELDIDLINNVKQSITVYDIKNKIEYDKTKVDLFEYLNTNLILIGIVTNSSNHTASMMLENVGLWYQFDKLITNEHIKNPKPDPEGYLLAFESLKVSPEEVIIVEDSDHGIAAARASGAHVLVVKNATEVTTERIKEAIEHVNNITPR